MLSRLAFYPTLLYNVLLERVSLRQWYSRIDDTVILGALPFKSMTQELVEEENVRAVITMNEPFETKYFVNSQKEWEAAGVEQLTIPTPDFGLSPSADKLQLGVDFILHHRTAGNSVYVHCKAGRSRSATLVACYLSQVHGWGPEQSVEFIKQKRPQIQLYKAQRRELYYFCRNISINS